MSGVSHSERRHWDRMQVALAVIGCILFFALYHQVLTPLVAQWQNDDNYRHGFLVPIISGIILYLRRGQLRDAPYESGVAPGILVLALSAAFLVVGTAAGELMTSRLSVPTFLLGCALFLGGKAFTRRALFPILFLFMMIPLPYLIYYKIAFPLQLLGAKISAATLDSLGVHVLRHGNILHMPNYSLEVVAACSGIRSLMTMVTLSLIVGVFSDMNHRKRFLLVLFAVPAALAANVLRLIVTAIGAQVVSPEFADGFLHTFSGILVFATGLGVLLLAYALLRRV